MLWLTSFLLELLVISTSGTVRIKKLQAWLLLLVIASSTVYSTGNFDQWFLLVVALLLPFRILNILRIIKGRMHPNYLRKVTLRTSLSLIGMHVFGLIVTLPKLIDYWKYFPYFILITSAVMLFLIVQHLYKTRHITNKKHYSDKELPTVSVCIPARNETDSLEQCLQSIIANDYPKLEILVLDDCSQDKTADIIKGFAHDGVRFVQGDEPSGRWLAKNQAYDKLTKEATGELVLYCGVDVRLGSHAIRSLVTTMLNRQKSMISVMPLRFYSHFSEAFIQPMRYWWELVPPRKLVNRPPVLSTCWLVDRKLLNKAGGFSAVSHAILPEGYFARYFIKNNKYSFIRADEELDVRTAKPLNEQWTTAVRTNYPQIRRRPEMALLLTLFTFVFLIMPFITLAYAILASSVSLLIISIITCLILSSIHVLVLQYSDPANVPVGLLTFPLAAFIEVLIGYYSMLKYEFGTMDWKDRNVCIPVMHVVPKQDFLANAEIN